MAAVWMRFRAELRSGWRVWLTLAFFAGLAGGVLVAAAAGARRTDSALARHVVAYRFPDITVSLGDGVGEAAIARKVAELPQVEASSVGRALGFVARDAKNEQVRSAGPHAMRVQVSGDARDGLVLGRWKLLAGRRPTGRPSEALVDSRAAETLGVGPGDTFRLRVFEPGEPGVDFWGDPRTMRAGRLVELRVVGVQAATDTVDHPGGVVRLTPAFYRAHPLEQYWGAWLSVRLRHGAADLPAFRRAVERITGSGGLVEETRLAGLAEQRDHTAKIQRSIHLQAQALWLAAAVGALLAFVLLSQALVRVAGLAAHEHRILRAVGMTRGQLLAVGVIRAGVVATFAAALAVGVALALSPLTPIGWARELEPDSGFALDALTVGLGGTAVLVAVLVAGALATLHVVRAHAGPSRPSSAPAGTVAAEALARWGLPATVVTGVRLALARSRGPTAVPVGATLFGSVLAVAVAVTALTFSASLDHLFSTPRLYGQTWDYGYVVIFDDSTDRVRQRVTEELAIDSSISDAAFGTERTSVQVSGRNVAVRAMDGDIKGELLPAVIDGRAPQGPNEILLGTKTLDALGLEIGDSVGVRGVRSARMHIVGRGVVAGTGSSLGEGAAMTFRALQHITPSTPQDLCCLAVEVRVAPDRDRDATLARLEQGFGAPTPGLPRTVADFGGVDEMPFVLSALLIALAAGALAHTLVMAIRRRSRDLAILKTLGFDRRQVLATVAWQATTFGVVGLLVGIPLGLAAGRWAWNLFAEELGVVPEPVTPVPLILLVVPGAVLLANLVASVPARIAAGTRPAIVLRAE